MGRPGLIGMAARTAVVAGTATAVAGGVAHHQERKAEERYEAQQYEQEQTAAAAAPQYAPPQQYTQPQYTQPPAPAGPAAPSQDDMASELQRLAGLKEQGILSDDEFQAAKAKLLS
jgi:hypothetical protein